MRGKDIFSCSYYPGAAIPLQEQLVFDNVRVLHDEAIPLLSIATPVNMVTLSNCHIRNNRIHFLSNRAMRDYLKTNILIYGCNFEHQGAMDLLVNAVEDKEVLLKTFGNVALYDDFLARIVGGKGKIVVESDLPGLKVK